MKLNSFFPALVSGITLSSIFLAGVLPANAVTLDYSLNGTFRDVLVGNQLLSGGSFSGTFSADSVTQSLTNYSITTTTGAYCGPNGCFNTNPGFTYQFGAPNNSFKQGAFFGNSDPSNSFTLFVSNPPPLPCCGAVDPIKSILSLQFDGSIFNPPSSGVLNVDVTGNPLVGNRQNSFEVWSIFATEYREREVDSGIATTQPIPEPLSIIGTLIGGGAVWRMRKKLTVSTKVKVKQ
jgi:hypothetical protein